MGVDTPDLPMLDHVAIHVQDRDSFAAELLDRLDVHVIERTDRFTLVGADARFGKLTLLDPIDDRAPRSNRIVSLVLAESAATDTPPPITLTGGLVITFAAVDALGPEWSATPRHALVGVGLRVLDPPLAAAALDAGHPVRLGQVAPDIATLEVGHGATPGRLTLARERWDEESAPSMLDHVGIRVADAAAERDRLERDGLDIERWVEAAHSRAVFVAGPEGLLVEYVELTRPLEG